MRLLPFTAPLALIFLAAASAWSPTQAAKLTPNYWNWATTPPMGWNSYDSFGASVTEDEFMANATYVKDHLLSHGWHYVVVDYRWYDPAAKGNESGATGEPLTMDANGRLLPAPNRFPSASNGHGFKALADKVHALGLKFGIHVMRGIPRLAVKANMPIKGSHFHASDAANTQDTCSWSGDMYGVKGETPAGQAYYDSLARLWASWGVDFVKIDDLSQPYRTNEIHAIRNAIDKCGRAIVFSTSPGETPVEDAKDISTHANMWRASSDFWDAWSLLDHAFDLANAWSGYAGPGHWPDLDMIPVGHIGLRSVDGPRLTRFTHDEQLTLFSLWALAPSPLMLGANLPENDDWTLSLLTNDEVLGINQDPLGKQGKRVSQKNGAEVWVKELKDGSKAIGLFNRSGATQTVTLTWTDAGLSGKQALRDLWQHKDLGSFDQTFAAPVPAHGVVFVKATASAN